MLQLPIYKNQINRKGIPFLLLLSFIFSFISVQKVVAQESSIKESEAALKTTFGTDKLILLNELTSHFQENQSGKALRYGRRAVALGENLYQGLEGTKVPAAAQPLLQAYFQLGEVFFERENYISAREHLEAAEALGSSIGNNTYREKTVAYLRQIEQLEEEGELKEGFLSRTFRDIEVGKALREATNELKVEAEIKLAEGQTKKKNFQGAIKHYDNAINFLRDLGDVDRIQELQESMAFLTDSIDQHLEASDLISIAIKDINEKEEKVPFIDLKDLDLPDIPEIKKELSQLAETESIRQEKETFRKLSDRYANQKDFEKSMAYYIKYQELARKIVEDSLFASNENLKRESQLALLEQQNKIADLTVETLKNEKAKAIQFRNAAILVTLVVLFGTIITFYFYFIKRREHRRLSIAYRDLDKTKNKLVNAEQKIVKLLRQQVSGAVAQELLSSGSSQPGGKHFVCIMFLDIRDFTPKVERMSPEEIISYQNNVFGFMIDIVQKYNGNINQLLGDGFMATFGAPESHGNDCQNAYLAAREILQEIKDRNEAAVIPKTKVGIGLHAGFVVTGNVGNEARKQYSVTGNPVIIASRIEQLNKTYQSQLIITEEVAKKLEGSTELKQAFLEVSVKGRSTPVKILKIA